MQKISPIHNLILQVRQILGSYELNGHTIFDHAHPKIIESTFSSPEFPPACKKPFHSIYSFLRYCQFLSPVTRLATPIFEHVQHKRFFINFKCMGICITSKKSRNFIPLFWRYGWLNNPAIWLAENILAHIKFFHIWDLCRNTSNNINFHYGTNSVKINDQIFQ